MHLVNTFGVHDVFVSLRIGASSVRCLLSCLFFSELLSWHNFVPAIFALGSRQVLVVTHQRSTMEAPPGVDAHEGTAMLSSSSAVEDELAKYDNFDMETYDLRKEKELSDGLKGDTMKRPPISRSWLTWRVQVPNLMAVVTITVLSLYELIVIVSMFAVGLRRALVEDGLMYALCALNVALCLLLAGAVVAIKYDWSLGVLTRSLRRGRLDVEDDD